jgi:hypothetical protein
MGRERVKLSPLAIQELFPSNQMITWHSACIALRQRTFGGVRVKTSRFLWVVILIGLSAAVAKADGLNDPRIIIHLTGDPAPYDGSAPLVESFTDGGFSLGFVYTGSTNLNQLVLNLTNVPIGEIFQCFTDVWVGCAFGVTSFDSETQTLTYTFLFSDPTPGVGGACQNNSPAGGTCPGFLAPGDTFSVTLATPEPSTMLLLLAGLVPLLGFGRKRWRASRAV